MCANKNDQSTFDNVLEYQTYESKIDGENICGFRKKMMKNSAIYMFIRNVMTL